MQEKGKIYQMVEERKKEIIQSRIWLENDYKEQGLGDISKETQTVFHASIATLNEILPEIEKLEPAWIPVWERLPEQGDFVNIVNHGQSDSAYYEPHGWFSDRGPEPFVFRFVTHWQELPLPPR